MPGWLRHPLLRIHAGVGQKPRARRQHPAEVGIEEEDQVRVAVERSRDPPLRGVGRRLVVGGVGVGDRKGISPTEHVTLPHIVPLERNGDRLTRTIEERQVTQAEESRIRPVAETGRPACGWRQDRAAEIEVYDVKIPQRAHHELQALALERQPRPPGSRDRLVHLVAEGAGLQRDRDAL
jgi:hypothetical protein